MSYSALPLRVDRMTPNTACRSHDHGAACSGVPHMRRGHACTSSQLLSTNGRWLRIRNATATPPLAYQLESKAGDGMRRHEQRHRLEPSIGPYPEYIMWRWHPSQGCTLPVATREAFCSVMSALRLKRIMVVGDSMQWNMAQSLWKVLTEARGDPAKVHGPRNGKIIRSTVECPRSSPGAPRTKLGFTFLLNNRVTNCTKRFWEGPFEFFPWVSEYLAGDAPTLLLAHTGAHVRSVAVFNEVMDSFFHSVSLGNRSLDRVVLRTATPGQDGCENYSRPFARPSAFELHPGGTANMSYRWDLHPTFNAIAAQHVTRAAASGALAGRVALLDVYTMTTMRPDGRRSGGDCLHFFLPGVPDWWTHLLLALLRQWSEATGTAEEMKANK